MNLLIDFGFKHIIRVYNVTAGIDNRKNLAVPFSLTVIAVTGHPRNLINYCLTCFGKAIKQGRFAHIRPSYYCQYSVAHTLSCSLPGSAAPLYYITFLLACVGSESVVTKIL